MQVCPSVSRSVKSILKVRKCRPSPALNLRPCCVIPMSSLLNRLKKLQVVQPEELPDLTKYSLEQMDQMKVEFGTKHAGRTFLEVWNTNQQWLTWFLKHYHASTKGVHRLLIKYIELKIERAELENQVIPVTEPQPQVTKDACIKEPEKPSLGLLPKAKAAPWYLPEVDEMSVWDQDVTSQASMPVEHTEVLPQWENRMQQMEGAIQAIMHHLEMMSVNQGRVRDAGEVEQ